MTLIGEIRGENGLFPSDTFAIPGSSTNFSRAPFETTCPNPGVNLGLAIKWAWCPLPLGRRRYDKTGLLMQDVVSRATSISYTFAHPRDTNTAIDTYSMRFYLHTNPGSVSALHHFISFREGATVRWSLYGGDYAWSGSGSPFDFNEYGSNQPYLVWPGGGTTRSLALADQLLQSKVYRVEVQVQPTSPKITVTIYDFDSTTPFKTITTSGPQDATITSTSTNVFEIGSPNATYCPETWYGDLEWYDTYDLDGTAGDPYVMPTYSWAEWIDPDEVAVEDAGTWDAVTETEVPDAHFTDFDREIVYDESNWTFHSAVQVRSVPSYGYNDVDMWIPNRPAPAAGWPVVVWVHGGFFIQGNRTDIPPEFVKHCLYRGYAVLSVNYHMGEALIGLSVLGVPITLDTWPAPNSGRYPTFYIDVKAAGNFVHREGAQGTGLYPLNPDRMAVCGYSAGANIALGAAASTDLDSFNGVDLTVNNATYGEGAGTSDPVWKCAYGWASPVDLALAWDWDPTHPTQGPGWLLGNTTMGSLRVTGNAYFGRTYNTNSRDDLEDVAITKMIEANVANCPPLGICEGRSDYVVHWEHGDALEATCTAESIPFTRTSNPGFHDVVNQQFNEQHFFNFLKEHV